MMKLGKKRNPVLFNPDPYKNHVGYRWQDDPMFKTAPDMLALLKRYSRACHRLQGQPLPDDKDDHIDFNFQDIDALIDRAEGRA